MSSSLEPSSVTAQRNETSPALLYAVMQALARARTCLDGVREVLHAVCEEFGWSGGEYWQAPAVATAVPVMTRSVAWWTPRLRDSPIAGTGAPTFARDLGLPVAVRSTGSPVWIGDLRSSPGVFARPGEALSAGLTSALALPVHSGDDVGVLLFLGEGIRRPDPQLSVTLDAVCAHLGRFLERQRAEELRLSLDQVRGNLDRIIANMDDHLWTFELFPDGQIRAVFSSCNIAHVLGGDPGPGPERGALMSSLVHPDDQPLYVRFLREITAGHGAEVECRLVGLDGVTRWIWNRAALRREGDRLLIDGISSDVSVRKQGEIDLQDERRRLRQAQAIGRVGSWELHLADDVLTWSPNLGDLYGLGLGPDVTRQDLRGCQHPDDADLITAGILHCARTGEPFQSIYRVIRPIDGQVRQFETRVEAVCTDAGDVFAVAGTATDITERQRVSEAMAEATAAALAANAAKSSFLTTMSHEIRTPMNAVIGMTDLLLGTSLNPVQQEYVETIRTSGDALLAVINNILDFSRIEAGEMGLDDEPFDLRRVIEDCLSPVAATATAAGLNLVADVHPDCPRHVRGDGNRLRQVLVNLVSNAVKFTPDGDVLVSVAPDRPGLSFSVRDTGIGIPADGIHRLFASFSQVDASTTRVYGGSGLGLAISRALVRAMGGDITLTSTEGVGSTFRFTLRLPACPVLEPELGVPAPAPRRQAANPAANPALTPAHVPQIVLRVLLAEDNLVNQMVGTAMLRGLGHVVGVAADGQAALRAVRSTDYDVVLMDLHMPLMDGLEATEAIRESLPAQRQPYIVALTASSLPEEHRACVLAGMNGLLLKPVRAADLAQTLRDIPDAATIAGRRSASATTAK